MLLRPAEVKQNYKLSHTTLFDLENRGVLRPVKTLGGHRRYRKKDIDELMQTGVKDSIGYVLQINFNNYQKMPQTIEIVGNTKPSCECKGAFWDNELDHLDVDKIPTLDIGKYRQIRRIENGCGWSFNVHPRIRTMSLHPPMEVVLEGSENTGIYTAAKKFCDFVQKDEDTIQLSMSKIMRHLEFKHDISDELPLFLMSQDAKLEENRHIIQPIMYELVNAR